MDVRCEKCGTEYEFDEDRIGPNGVTVKCTNCGHVFKVRRPGGPRRNIPRASTAIGAGPQGREWLVRKPDGQMIAFRELTTLQKWIVEGRIQRDDEISKNGETWKRLGNIMELEPFFSVYEKAQTLNSLIEQAPVELRGSELLSAVDPSSGPQYPIPSRSQIVQADALPSQLPSQIPQTLPPPLPPRSQPAMAMGPTSNMGAPILSAPPERVHSGAGLDRPLDRGPAPASFGSSTLDFPIRDDDPSETDPVANFQRGRRRSRVLVVGGLFICLALGASLAVAMYGPPDNALRALAVKYELLPKEALEDEATPLIQDAAHEVDLDTLASQSKALDLLSQAQGIRPSDMTVAADRALHVAMLSLSLGDLAQDLGKDPDPAIAATAAAKTAQRDRLLEQLPTLLKAPKENAPDALATLRAEAAAAMAQGQAAPLDAAQAAAGQAGRTDWVLLYLSARQHAAAPEGRAAAQADLEKALTARPTFQRARVLSAALALEANELDKAKASLQQVLTAAPEHELAKHLMARVTAAEEAAKAPPPPPPPAEPAPVAKTEPEEPEEKGFDYWMKRADRLRRRDQTMAALNAYGRAAELSPNSPEVHVGKGWCLMDLERPHPALAAFERALAVSDRFAEAYYGKGEALRAIGQSEAAIKAYETYLARAPGSAGERKVVERRLKELRGG
ncbi:MAG: zinc-ribbon domain-containing protein [Deltaproteobacteria bacterium]|nr:zinc-ribbon domain-containing protein [Deltaproteobacteria bacterium]